VAVVHFHLRRGGVTRVIETAAASLLPHGVDLLVLAGDAPDTLELNRDQLAVVPDLDYRETFDPQAAARLKDNLESAARARWGALPDLWHVHNHSLGKNLELPWVIARWAEEGQRLLLQPHDFAEDGRPANYRRLREVEGLIGRLYPVGPRVLYALLNSRDRRLLNAAGVPANHTLPLPNAVQDFERRDEPMDLSAFGAERLILYPSRSIRRKNLGEVLLHSAVADKGAIFGCTLAPENPTARAVYDRWVAFARERALPVEFNLGPRSGASLEAMMAASEALITTSVAEGFGLAFLEPWLAGRRLVGRNLPEITADFTEAGMDLSGLYEELPVPLDWLDRDALRRTLSRAMAATFAAYQRPLPETAVETFFHGESIDFGRLDETLQEQVIERVMNDADAADQLRRMRLLSGDGQSIERNRAVVRESFGAADYGRRLHGFYTRLIEAGDKGCDWLDPDRLLDQFLSPERFCLLRT